jgi:signal transduction histidine kinase
LTLFRYILTFFITICCTSIAGQPGNYYIQHFNNENGLPQNSIKAIEIDNKGYLWLGTEMGVVRYDGSNFKLYDRINSPELGTDRILNMGLLRDGNIFALVEDYGYYHIGTNGVLQPIEKNYQEKNILDHFSISKIYTIYNKCKWKYENGQIAKWAVPNYTLITSSLLNSLVFVKSQYYYFNQNRDLITADTNLITFRKVGLKGQLSSLSGNKMNYKGEPGALLVRNNTLYIRYEKYIYKLSSLNSDYALREPVLYVGDIPDINCFLEVPSSNMFVVGTTTDGFYTFQKHLFSTLTLSSGKSNVFYAQAPYGNNGVLTNKGILFPGKHIPLPTGDITYESILKTRDGKYYLNRMHDEFKSGVIELDSQLHELRYFRGYNVHVNCFRQFQNGSIWLSLKGQLFGRIENNQINWFDFKKSLPQEFRVNTFIESSANELWIGGNKGLVRINLSSGKTFRIPELMDVEIRNLYEDKRGTIWIGTYGNGYYAFYKGKCIAMPMDTQHLLAATHTFMEDDSGNVWLATNRGLFQAHMADLYEYLNRKSNSVYYFYYDKTAGFLTNEFNGGCTPAGIKLNDGKFSLPSINGLVQFYPDSIKPVFPGAQIYVDAIAGDTTIFSTKNESLSISHNINHLQFTVSSPYFGNSYNQYLEYQLDKDGSDSDAWYRVPKSGYIQFNRLPPGKYQLLVRKKGGFGKDNYITKKIGFSIPPFFYETWLFRILMIAALLLSVYSFFRFRILFLSQQKVKLENEVSEKTKEQQALIYNLETTVSELERSELELNKSNHLKEELVMIIAHDLQSPLRFISSSTQRLHYTLLNKDYYEAQVLSSELSNSSYNIHRFVEDFTLWLSTLRSSFHSENTGISVYNLVVELRNFFTELLTMNRNEMEIDIDESLVVYTDYQLLKIILRNIIDNANKHTHVGIIRISAKIENLSACISISDDGSGMKEETLQKIQLQIKQETTNVDSSRKLHGNGYRFITHFCDLLNIHLEVESELGQGTKVELSNLKI